MGVDYAVVEQAIDEVDGLAKGLEGLAYRLDQYEAAEDTGELPADMADMDELQDEVATYFRATLPYHREIASWGYTRLETAIQDLEADFQNPREAGFTPESLEDAERTYEDAMYLQSHYFGLLRDLRELDRRAAELVGPEVIAQAKWEAHDIHREPTLPGTSAATGGLEDGTSIEVTGPEDDTDSDGTPNGDDEDDQTHLGDF